MSVKENILNGHYEPIDTPCRGDYGSQDAYSLVEKLFLDSVLRCKINFRNDLEEEHGMQNHPKADKIWGMANRVSNDDADYGGEFSIFRLNEIADCYDELVSLTK